MCIIHHNLFAKYKYLSIAIILPLYAVCGWRLIAFPSYSLNTQILVYNQWKCLMNPLSSWDYNEKVDLSTIFEQQQEKNVKGDSV